MPSEPKIASKLWVNFVVGDVIPDVVCELRVRTRQVR
jgi:hypothetical protein